MPNLPSSIVDLAKEEDIRRLVPESYVHHTKTYEACWNIVQPLKQVFFFVEVQYLTPASTSALVAG